jgi:hypothetical protein
MKGCLINDLARELKQFPGVEAQFSRRKKHNQVTLFHQGKSRFVVFPATAGDGQRALKNVLRDCRSELRHLGAIH